MTTKLNSALACIQTFDQGHALESYKVNYNGRPAIANVFQDDCNDNPLTWNSPETDGAPILWLWWGASRNYDLGHENAYTLIEEYLIKACSAKGINCDCLDDWAGVTPQDLTGLLDQLGTLYSWVEVYEHSGIAMRLTGKDIPGSSWDSGPGGLCVWPEESIREYTGTTWADSTDTAGQQAVDYDCMHSWFETYASYIAGEVYYIAIQDIEDGHVLDSCGGFYLNGKYTAEDCLADNFDVLAAELISR